MAHRLLTLSLPPDTHPSASIGLITAVRLWRRVGPISTAGNLVVYERSLVFATVDPREGWLSRIAGGTSTRDAQFRRIGQEQATLEPQRLASRSRRNMLIDRDRVQHATLVQSRASDAGVGDDLVGGVLSVVAEVGASTKQVLSISLQGVRAKVTIQGTWGAPECEWLERALGDRLVVPGS